MRQGPIILAAVDKSCTLWTLTTPDYSPKFVSELKGIPQDKRSWDPLGKKWIIDGEWAQHVADLAVAHFPGCEVEWRE